MTKSKHHYKDIPFYLLRVYKGFYFMRNSKPQPTNNIYIIKEHSPANNGRFG